MRDLSYVRLGLASVVLAAGILSAVAIGCGGDDNNPIIGNDAAKDTNPPPDTGGGDSGGGDSGGGDSSGGDSSGGDSGGDSNGGDSNGGDGGGDGGDSALE